MSIPDGLCKPAFVQKLVCQDDKTSRAERLIATFFYGKIVTQGKHNGLPTYLLHVSNFFMIRICDIWEFEFVFRE